MFLKRFQNVIILQFVFQGIRGKGYQGDIALDDIRVLDGTCPPSRMLNLPLCSMSLSCSHVKSTLHLALIKSGGQCILYQTGGLR